VPKNLEQIFYSFFFRKKSTRFWVDAISFFASGPWAGALVHFSKKIVFPVQTE